jgi:hypothetical protein
LLYEQHSDRKTRPKLAECFELLHIELTACSKAFIIVDALDECDEISGARSDLISQLMGLPLNTYVMVTSRELPSIEHELCLLCRLEIRASDVDVRTYLEGRIEREFRLSRHVQADPTLRNIVLGTIVKKVKGMLVVYVFPPTFGLLHQLIESQVSSCPTAYRILSQKAYSQGGS